MLYNDGDDDELAGAPMAPPPKGPQKQGNSSTESESLAADLPASIAGAVTQTLAEEAEPTKSNQGGDGKPPKRIPSPGRMVKNLASLQANPMATIRKLRHILLARPKDWVQAFVAAEGLDRLLDLLLMGYGDLTQRVYRRVVHTAKLLFDININFFATGSCANKLLHAAFYRDSLDETRHMVFAILTSMVAILGGGHNQVISAFDYVKYRNHLNARFQWLVSMIQFEKMSIKTDALTLINALINTPEDLDARIEIRNEFLSLNLDGLFSSIRDIGNASLSSAIYSFEEDRKLDLDEIGDRLGHAINVIQPQELAVIFAENLIKASLGGSMSALPATEVLVYLNQIPFEDRKAARLWYALSRITHAFATKAEKVWMFQSQFDLEEIMQSAALDMAAHHENIKAIDAVDRVDVASRHSIVHRQLSMLYHPDQAAEGEDATVQDATLRDELTKAHIGLEKMRSAMWVQSQLWQEKLTQLQRENEDIQRKLEVEPKTTADDDAINAALVAQVNHLRMKSEMSAENLAAQKEVTQIIHLAAITLAQQLGLDAIVEDFKTSPGSSEESLASSRAFLDRVKERCECMNVAVKTLRDALLQCHAAWKAAMPGPGSAAINYPSHIGVLVEEHGIVWGAARSMNWVTETVCDDVEDRCRGATTENVGQVTGPTAQEGQTARAQEPMTIAASPPPPPPPLPTGGAGAVIPDGDGLPAPPPPPGTLKMAAGPEAVVFPQASEPMVPFFWVKMAENKKNNTVFDGIALPTKSADTPPPIDLEPLDVMFRAKVRPKDTAAKASLATKPKPSMMSTVEPRRLQNVSIFLQTMKQSVQDTKKAILMLDNGILSNGDIASKLIANAPTEAEAAALLNHLQEGPSAIEEMHQVDRFFFVLSQIPQVHQRLECYLLVTSFPGRHKQIEVGLEMFQAANRALERLGPHLDKLIHVVLYIGNYLNAKTPRGAAAAFKPFPSLIKLADVRSTSDPNVTLLSYIASKLTPQVQGGGGPPPSAASAAPNPWEQALGPFRVAEMKLNWGSLLDQFAALKQSVITSQNNVKVVTEATGMDAQWDVFYEQIPSSIASMDAQVAAMEKRMEGTFADYLRFGQKYAVDSDLAPEALFKTLSQFCNMYIAAQKKNEEALIALGGDDLSQLAVAAKTPLLPRSGAVPTTATPPTAMRMQATKSAATALSLTSSQSGGDGGRIPVDVAKAIPELSDILPTAFQDRPQQLFQKRRLRRQHTLRQKRQIENIK